MVKSSGIVGEIASLQGLIFESIFIQAFWVALPVQTIVRPGNPHRIVVSVDAFDGTGTVIHQIIIFLFEHVDPIGAYSLPGTLLFEYWIVLFFPIVDNEISADVFPENTLVGNQSGF